MIRTEVVNRVPQRTGVIGRQLRASVKQGLRLEGQQLERELVSELDAQGRSVSGDLRKSIHSSVKMLPNLGLLQVGPGIEYAPYVELGTRPHWVPISALLPWVRKRRLAGRYSVKSRKRLGNKYVQRFEDYDMARAIQLRIAHHGTEAHPFVEPVFDREEDAAVGRMNKVVSNAVRLLNRN